MSLQSRDIVPRSVDCGGKTRFSFTLGNKATSDLPQLSRFQRCSQSVNMLPQSKNACRVLCAFDEMVVSFALASIRLT